MPERPAFLGQAVGPRGPCVWLASLFAVILCLAKLPRATATPVGPQQDPDNWKTFERPRPSAPRAASLLFKPASASAGARPWRGHNRTSVWGTCVSISSLPGSQHHPWNMQAGSSQRTANGQQAQGRMLEISPNQIHSTPQQ